MAITIYDEPESYTPAYNPVVFTLDSTNNGQTNFKYVVDVQISGQPTSQRFKIPADPDNGYGVIDISKYVSSYVTHDISLSDQEVEECPNSIKKVTVTVGEEYGDPVAVTGAMASGNDFYIFNGALRFRDAVNYDATDYLMTGTSDKFLTNMPEVVGSALFFQRISNNEYAWLYGITDTAGEVYYVQVFTFDEVDLGGNLLGQYRITYDGQALASVDDRMFRTPAGWNLNNLNGASVTAVSGATPILTSSVKSYYIATFASNGTTRNSVTMSFNVVDRDCRFEAIRLHWLNVLGGFDSFTFDLVSKYTFNNEKRTFKRQAGAWSNTSWSITAGQPQRAAYFTKETHQIKITSNWMTKTEYDVLAELLTSPVVYYQDGAELVFCRVVESTYQEKTVQSDKLINLEITIEFGYDNYRQTW